MEDSAEILPVDTQDAGDDDRTDAVVAMRLMMRINTAQTALAPKLAEVHALQTELAGLWRRLGEITGTSTNLCGTCRDTVSAISFVAETGPERIKSAIVSRWLEASGDGRHAFLPDRILPSPKVTWQVTASLSARLLATIESHPAKSWTAIDLANVLGEPHGKVNVIRATLSRLSSDAKITKVSHGAYVAMTSRAERRDTAPR